MQEVKLDKIVNLVVKEVVAQLKKQGIKVVDNSSQGSFSQNINNQLRSRTEVIDMSKYQSPILTERQLKQLHELTGKIIVPQKTVITPKASEIIKKKNLKLEYE